MKLGLKTLLGFTVAAAGLLMPATSCKNAAAADGGGGGVPLTPYLSM